METKDTGLGQPETLGVAPVRIEAVPESAIRGDLSERMLKAAFKFGESKYPGSGLVRGATEKVMDVLQVFDVIKNADVVAGIREKRQENGPSAWNDIMHKLENHGDTSPRDSFGPGVEIGLVKSTINEITPEPQEVVINTSDSAVAAALDMTKKALEQAKTSSIYDPESVQRLQEQYNFQLELKTRQAGDLSGEQSRIFVEETRQERSRQISTDLAKLQSPELELFVTFANREAMEITSNSLKAEQFGVRPITDETVRPIEDVMRLSELRDVCREVADGNATSIVGLLNHIESRETNRALDHKEGFDQTAYEKRIAELSELRKYYDSPEFAAKQKELGIETARKALHEDIQKERERIIEARKNRVPEMVPVSKLRT